MDSAPRTILILDDDAQVREVVGCMLECRGYSVLATGDPEEAIGLLDTHTVDAAIVDFDMPETNGVDACRALQRHAAILGRNLMVWLMTGFMRPGLVTSAIAAGAMGVIPKPFTTDQLVNCVESGLAA